MKKLIIQDEISVGSNYIDKIINHYKNLPEYFRLSMGDFDGNKDDIIREIKDLSEVGKKILMMRYKFDQWKGHLNRK